MKRKITENLIYEILSVVEEIPRGKVACAEQKRLALFLLYGD